MAGRWWLSGGRGKSIKKSRRVAELREEIQRLTIENYSYVTTKKINAEKLLAPQSVCENVKIFRIFIQ
nr:hypothetical protein [Escherichia coli]